MTTLSSKSNISNIIWIFIVALFLLQSCGQELEEYYMWEAITIDFEGPSSSESDEYNPFLNYRLDVTFINGEHKYVIPGYFAADGLSSESSAESGNIWRVKFNPDKIGVWEYSASFKRGDNIAISSDDDGENIPLEQASGKFNVIEGNFPKNDFRTQGRLKHIGHESYQQFQGSKKFYIKGGADSPENFLGFADFDSTYNYEGSSFLHHYDPHAIDWKEGDPQWKNGKGKNIIGALNYLASKGMNSIYFLSMNIEGDGKDVWPYISHKDFLRFDCSKLDQWDIVFSHAQKLGILIQFVLQETENELLLDGGDTDIQRKIYLRELIARFGHHNAVVWNIGEENGPADFSPQGQSTAQRKAMLNYIAKTDPYDHLRVIHTHAASRYKDSILVDLLGFENLGGLSLQVDDVTRIPAEIEKWKELSSEAGHPWIIYMDEIGPYWAGAMPDSHDIAHDTIRKEALWGSIMSGAAGIEWYFGYKYPHADLNCEDWRSRDKLWDQTRMATHLFLYNLPFSEMEPMPGIVISENALCMAKENDTYIFYIPEYGPVEVDLRSLSDQKYRIQWYNPRNGDATTDKKEYDFSDITKFSPPPEVNGNDWVLLVIKDKKL